MPETQNAPPLWKQLLGAATGAVVALLLYGGFTVVSPHLSTFTAYLLSDFEGKVENLPTYQQSPRTIRDKELTRREELGSRASAVIARPQSSSSLSSVATAVPSTIKEKEKAPKEKAVSQKKQDQLRPKEKGEEKRIEQKRKEEKLPATGVPLWAIGGVAFGLAMSLRHRRELCGVLQKVGK